MVGLTGPRTDSSRFSDLLVLLRSSEVATRTKPIALASYADVWISQSGTLFEAVLALPDDALRWHLAETMLETMSQSGYLHYKQVIDALPGILSTLVDHFRLRDSLYEGRLVRAFIRAAGLIRWPTICQDLAQVASLTETWDAELGLLSDLLIAVSRAAAAGDTARGHLVREALLMLNAPQSPKLQLFAQEVLLETVRPLIRFLMAAEGGEGCDPDELTRRIGSCRFEAGTEEVRQWLSPVFELFLERERLVDGAQTRPILERCAKALGAQEVFLYGGSVVPHEYRLRAVLGQGPSAEQYRRLDLATPSGAANAALAGGYQLYVPELGPTDLRPGDGFRSALYMPLMALSTHETSTTNAASGSVRPAGLVAAFSRSADGFPSDRRRIGGILAWAMALLANKMDLRQAEEASVRYHYRDHSTRHGALAPLSSVVQALGVLHPLFGDNRPAQKTAREAYGSALVALCNLKMITYFPDLEAEVFIPPQGYCRPATVFELVELMAAGKARGKGIRLDVAAPPADLEMDCSLEYTRDALYLYLENSIKYSQAGEKIALSFAEMDDDRVRLTITDHAGGFASWDDLQKALRPYSRLHNDRPGSGISFPAAHRFAKAMGCEVDYEIPPGQLIVHITARRATVTSRLDAASGTRDEGEQ